MEPPTIITLRIKVPPGHLSTEGSADEFTLGNDIAVATRIGEIRERIQHLIPTNPAPERQRLLYAGRALVDDEQTLGDALNIRRDPTQNEFVVHLLVKGTSKCNSTAAATAPHARSQNTNTDPALASQAHTNGHGSTSGPATGESTQQQEARILAEYRQLQQTALQQADQNAHLRDALAGQLHQGQGVPPVGILPPQFNHALHGLPPQFAAPFLGFQPPQIDGARDAHPTPLPDQPDPHQRSASQPPPRAHGQGVILEGRGPNGERFHFQQHIQVGHHHIPAGPGLPHLPRFGQPQPAPRRTGPSAAEQARDNLAEMRRTLDELRGLEGWTDEQRDRIDRLQQQTQRVHNFVDPLNLGGSTAPAARALNDLRAASTVQENPVPRASSQPPAMQSSAYDMAARNQHTTSSRTPADVTCYLLSSPTGPQAILYSPQHGTYTGSMSPVAPPPPTRVTQVSVNTDDEPPANQVQAVAAQPILAQAAAAPPDNLGALGPLLNHMWLLLRVLIFAYFILGANLGWRRPMAMLAIAIGFWLLRQGPLGEGGVLRRWWDGIVNQGQQRAVAGHEQGQAQARPGQMPTPAQVAQRLLDENRRQRNHGLSWLREQLRPAERAIALLIASLWPGVGEAYVRTLEAEERRRNEEEVATRRREEEERQRREEEEKKAAEEAASSPKKTERSEAPAADADPSTEADASKKETSSQDDIAAT